MIFFDDMFGNYEIERTKLIEIDSIKIQNTDEKDKDKKKPTHHDSIAHKN
jgi:hypothetical protein